MQGQVLRLCQVQLQLILVSILQIEIHSQIIGKLRSQHRRDLREIFGLELRVSSFAP